MVRNERGFTIVEAVVAILLLTIGFAGVAKATAGMTRMLSGGDRATTATIYARERLELLRATGCASMADGSQQLDKVYDVN